jgi:hypothetical protein
MADNGNVFAEIEVEDAETHRLKTELVRPLRPWSLSDG